MNTGPEAYTARQTSLLHSQAQILVKEFPEFVGFPSPRLLVSTEEFKILLTEVDVGHIKRSMPL